MRASPACRVSGLTRQLTYDLRGRTTEIKDLLSDSLSLSTKQSYDKKGQLTRITDRNGKDTQLTWDGLGRLIQVTDAANGVTRHTYDARDNLIAVTDANNNTTTYTYDKANRRTAETRPLGQTQTYQYDDTGNLTHYQDAKGNTIAYTYDAAGRRAQETHTPAGAATPSRTLIYTTNALGSLTGLTDDYDTGVAGNANRLPYRQVLTLDALQRSTEETITLGSNSWTTRSTWTPTGQKASQTSPGNLQSDYRYDANGQIAGVILPSGSLSIAERQWTAPKKILLPGGSTHTREYDGLLRPTRIKLAGPGQNTLLDYSYTYDPESNITQKATEHGAYTYGYDPLYRLTDVGNPSGLTNEQYSYDKLGNRLTDSNTNTLFTTNTWTYNANNQLTQGYTRNGDPITPTWDENGSLARNRTPDPASAPLENQRYVYDASNRISEVQDKDGNPIASYQYDPFGRRIVKTTPGNNTTVYLYSDEGLMAEATASGSIATEYGWQPGNLWGTDPLYIKTTKTNSPTPEVFYYQNDHLGTPQKAVDTQGNIVWEMKAQAFGETTVAPSSTITSNLRFPGQYADKETNTNYNYFRDYNPQTGRYIQSDPIGLQGGINTYIYVKGNPLRYSDPLGLYTYMCTKPLHGLGPDWGPRLYPTSKWNPLPTYHQFLCFNDGEHEPECGGLDRTGGALWSDGKPSVDTYPKNQPEDGQCKQVDDRKCVDHCVLRNIRNPKRPGYGIGPQRDPGDCQEWADSVLETCKKECRGKN